MPSPRSAAALAALIVPLVTVPAGHADGPDPACYLAAPECAHVLFAYRGSSGLLGWIPVVAVIELGKPVRWENAHPSMTVVLIEADLNENTPPCVNRTLLPNYGNAVTLAFQPAEFEKIAAVDENGVSRTCHSSGRLAGPLGWGFAYEGGGSPGHVRILA